ncbi:MAG: MFS transporter [Rhizobiaceae bacterium]
MSSSSTADPNASAKRNALLLATAQAFCGSAAPISIALGGLAGMYLLGDDKSLATAPVTGYNLGVALAALPAAMLMARIGRRYGFIAGASIGIIGAIVSSLAIFKGDFVLFCIGMAMSGSGGAFTQQYRFAAADQGLVEFKPKAISWVLAGGIFAAIIGPQTAIYFINPVSAGFDLAAMYFGLAALIIGTIIAVVRGGLAPGGKRLAAVACIAAATLIAYLAGPYVAGFVRNLFVPIEFAAAYLAGAILLLFGIAALSQLKFESPPSREERGRADSGRPLSKIMAQPRFIVAVICAVASYALMSFVMTGAPLAMKLCGFSPDESTLGIQWHVMAMFGPSFFTGNLISRFGKERIVATGMVLLLICAAVGLMGITLTNFYVALILLGFGWNFGFIGATAMLTDTYQPEERAKAQGANDFILFGSVAFGSFMSGQTLNAFGDNGWNAINYTVFPVVGICLLSLLWLRFAEGKAAAVR